MGRYEDALDVYNEYDEWILGRAGGGIRIEMADLVKILNPQDPFVQAKAYEDIVASMSKGNKLEAEFRARALQKLGGVYLDYGDYKGAAQILEQANLVVTVPGCGMAVAQAQHKVRELYDPLKKRGITVKFAIHPVAGRMPGHMNVLLSSLDA